MDFHEIFRTVQTWPKDCFTPDDTVLRLTILLCALGLTQFKPNWIFTERQIQFNQNILNCWYYPYLQSQVRIKWTLNGNNVSSLRWRHNGHNCVSNHHPHHCLLNRFFGRRSKKTSKLCVTGLCVGSSPGTGEFPAQMASNAENVSIWWRHH